MSEIVEVKIAFVNYEYPPDTAGGGIGTYAYQAAACLASRGHQVEVFAASLQRVGTFRDGLVQLNLTRPTSAVKFGDEVLPSFVARHREVGFDVVESPDYFADGRGIRKAFPDLAHVVKLHTPLERLHELGVAEPTSMGHLRHQERQFKQALHRIGRGQRPPRATWFRPQRPVISHLERVEQDNAVSAHLVVSPSTSLAKWAEAKWNIDARRIRVVPYPYRPDQALLECPMPAKALTVGYFGRIEHRKGMEDLIQAIPRVLARFPRTTFRFVGGANIHPGTLEPYDAFVRRKLKSWENAVALVGRVPLISMPSEYERVDICVIPSLWENFPNVCLEAMAAGRAIVATSSGGMEEMLEGGHHGVLVPPHSPEALAEAMISLLADPKRCAELGASARSRVIEAYDYDIVGPQLEESYRLAMDVVSRSIKQSVDLSKTTP